MDYCKYWIQRVYCWFAGMLYQLFNIVSMPLPPFLFCYQSIIQGNSSYHYAMTTLQQAHHWFCYHNKTCSWTIAICQAIASYIIGTACVTGNKQIMFCSLSSDAWGSHCLMQDAHVKRPDPCHVQIIIDFPTSDYSYMQVFCTFLWVQSLPSVWGIANLLVYDYII